MRNILAPSLLLLAGLASPAWGVPVAVDNHSFEDPYLTGNLPAPYAGDVPAGSFPTGGTPAGWTEYYPGGAAVPGSFRGVLNPGVQADYPPGDPAYFPLGCPDPDNAVLLYYSGAASGPEFGVSQDLGVTLQPNTRYTLTVEVGNIGSGTALVEPYLSQGFYDLSGFPGYRIELVAGGVTIGQDNNTLVTAGTLGDPGSEGTFQTSTLVVDIPGGHPQLDQTLTIRLISLNQADVPGVTGIEVDFDNVRLDATPLAAVPIGPYATWITAGLLGLLGFTALRRFHG